MCGMSVVGPEFERLKRFNLAELYEPSRGGGGQVENHDENEVQQQEAKTDSLEG